MLLKEIMQTDLHTVVEDSSILEVLEKMIKHSIRHVPVVKDNRLIGMVSERDVLMYCEPEMSDKLGISNPRAHLDVPVSEIMSSSPASVSLTDTVESAIDQLIALNVGALPVVDPESQKLVGILSYVDILLAAKSFF